jgi:2-polyprenyl-6-methoxyphenol hydroxylase-like FAD-dependent oxidoreductase
MEDLGLAAALHGLRHSKVEQFVVRTGGKDVPFADFSRLRRSTPYPYVLMLPQARFLDLLAERAGRLPSFRLVMGAKVRELVREGDAVRGVRYVTLGGEGREVRAALTVGTDGRFSRVRKLSGLGEDVAGGSPPIDVYWFDLPRRQGDPEGAGALFRMGAGSLLVLMDHHDHWQVGYLIEKDGYARLKESGLPALRRSVAALAPELADRVDLLTDFNDGSLLSVGSDCLRRWHRPGLLLLGDAAHVVSPVGGVGINLAIQDAVVAANMLAEPLKRGAVSERHLRAVQRRRRPAVRLVQTAQDFAQNRVVARALAGKAEMELPRYLRLALRAPVLRDVPSHLIARGAWPVRVRPPRRATSKGSTYRAS